MRLRIRPTYSIASLLIVTSIVAFAVRWYLGPHQYTFEEEEAELRARIVANDGWFCDTYPRTTGTFWAYRDQSGRLVRHGEEISFDQSGYKTERHYRHGELHGPIRTWRPDDDLASIGQYESGTEVGEWLSLIDGRVQSRKLYGEQGWTEQTFHEFGALETYCEFNRTTGEEVLTTFFPSGRKQFEGGYRDGLEHGIWRWYNEQGLTTREIEFREAVPLEAHKRPQLAGFLREIHYGNEFTEVPFGEVLDYYTDVGLKMRIECAERDRASIVGRLLTTSDGISFIRPGAALYLGLRNAGLDCDVTTNADGEDELVVYPAKS